MFLSHFALGFAAKPLAPRVSLGTLFLATQFVDLLWPTLLLLGLESVRIAPAGATIPLVFEHYPISHSLLAVIGWAVLLGALHFTARRSVRAAVVVAGLVVSHWLLDLIVHVPDLPLAPGAAPPVGLGLWQLPLAALALEGAVFAVGAALYLRSTQARDATGRLALWGLLALLVVIHLVNQFGPPPPSVDAVAWVGQAQWLLVAWAYAVDAHRVARGR
ncbi:hypothetical protein JI739_09645 [Ramlibacter sp. AW1]|uniref:Metal-dependent hydrolase n=1 Tax=Ramlibacter aurantiacus TaxID=2801330 RepID=A0A937D3D3_9BURK|nr:hypothetical protein [Ramlibacter aurantiacus]MBL0420605.1 hypothetical protein [Ramlibacter aurantiacus]